MSTPKEPIIFWLEKTIPFKYRKPIRDGILEWNKAFEKAGFYDAIEVRQQPDDAPWDPGDIRYNTFRWMTAGRASRWAPRASTRRPAKSWMPTLFSTADFLQVWKQDYETFTPASVASANGRRDSTRGLSGGSGTTAPLMQEMHGEIATLQHARRHVAQLALGASVMATAQTQRSRSRKARHARPERSDHARSRATRSASRTTSRRARCIRSRI